MTSTPTVPKPAPSPSQVGLDSEPPDLPKSASVTEAARARVDKQIRAMLAHQDGSLTGADPEDLHQFRVAVRRLRSLLKNTPAFGTDGEALRDELRWLAGVTSPIRDLDVMLIRISDEVAGFAADDRAAAASLTATLEAEREVHRAELARCLSGERYDRVIDGLVGLVTEVRDPAESGLHELTGTKLVGSLRKPFKKLAKAVRKLPDDPRDDDLHMLRIYGKRLRYAAETALPSASKPDAKRLKEIVGECKRLQDVLGDHQDAVVAADRIRELAAAQDDPRVAYVAGRLVEREYARRAAARARWPEVWQHIDDAASAVV